MPLVAWGLDGPGWQEKLRWTVLPGMGRRFSGLGWGRGWTMTLAAWGLEPGGPGWQEKLRWVVLLDMGRLFVFLIDCHGRRAER